MKSTCSMLKFRHGVIDGGQRHVDGADGRLLRHAVADRAPLPDRQRQPRLFVPDALVHHHDAALGNLFCEVTAHAEQGFRGHFERDDLAGASGERGAREETDVRARVDDDVAPTYAKPTGVAIHLLLLLSEHHREAPQVVALGHPDVAIRRLIQEQAFRILAHVAQRAQDLAGPGRDGASLDQAAECGEARAERVLPGPRRLRVGPIRCVALVLSAHQHG